MKLQILVQKGVIVVVIVWQFFLFITTYAISAYHHQHWVRILLKQGVLDTALWIKFVSDLRQVSGFLWLLRFPSPIKLTTTI